MDDVRYRTRMAIADDLASMARVGGNIFLLYGSRNRSRHRNGN